MIIQLLLSLFLNMFSLFQQLLHLPSFATLPWGIDGILVSAVAGFKAMSVVFPPFMIVYNAFIIYLIFKLLVVILRMIPFFGRSFD